jgi:flavin reductase (DIM6/NTAB) family NADH-FMN oxidoreductase RutF
MVAPTPQEWRAAMGYFPSGVTIITSWRGAAPVGTTASSFCSVSLEPALLLVCLDHNNPALAPIEASGVLGVNILGVDGRELALHFGRKGDDDRFAGRPYRAVDGGAPQLDAAPVFIDCRLDASHRAGDHQVLIGRAIHIEHAAVTPPLLYHKGAFPRLA